MYERAIRLLSLFLDRSSIQLQNRNTKSISLPWKMPYFQQVSIYHIKTTGKTLNVAYFQLSAANPWRLTSLSCLNLKQIL